MQGDVVIISDTEDVSDEEIAFVGITQTQPKPRISQAGPSKSNSVPIFIDSDDEDIETLEDDQDIFSFLTNSVTASSSTTTASSNGNSKIQNVKKDKKGKSKAVDDYENIGVNDMMDTADLIREFEKFENSILSKIDSYASLDTSTLKTQNTTITDIDVEVKEKADKMKKPKKRKSTNPNDETQTNSTNTTANAPTKKRQKSTEEIDSTLNDPKTKLTKEEREALKAKEKAEKQLQRDTLKAAKEAEKSYQKKLTEVNKLRISKNDTVREIHLYLSHDLSLPNSPISGSLPEIKTRITDNFSELHFLSEDQSPINGVIKFKRHLKARWDSDKKQFIPLDNPIWIWESTILMVINAEEIIDKISHSQSNQGEDNINELSLWISDIKLTLGLNSATDQLIIMIKGLNKYYSKSKSLANKEFTAAARAGLNGSSTSSNQPGNKSIGVRPDKETIEMALVQLQVKERCFLVHVEKTEDIEDWVYNIAADVAIRPYKLISKSHLNFCPTDGIKKASNPTETFELMLQEVQGITPSASMGISSEYSTFRELMESFEKAERRGGIEKAEIMLQDCEIKTLRNGTANGRKLNKALAKRVYNVFRGEDSLALA
ncbi:uncharacterized protein L201_000773 [Kwoniella dendrophila CBS 6074]|uniref:ERCC4 domain-containing protein n=1 Tax=Kwoniella dendrophila CBS 6074 TaxID=1295534 RepID=A0AAX4JNB2_9TREE